MNDVVISQSNSIANNKSLPPIIWRNHPWTHFVLLYSSAGPVPSLPKAKTPYQSDSMHHARDVCEGICNRKLLRFHIIANMGFWLLVMTGQALLMSTKGRNASKDVLVKLWEGVFVICNSITLWNNHVIIRVNMHIKRVDCLYNSINRLVDFVTVGLGYLYIEML